MSEIPPPTIPPATPPPPGGGPYTPPPPPPPYGGGPGVGGGVPSSDRTLMLVLSYAWLLSLIPLFTKRDDAEVQWHAKNGLVIAAIETIIMILWEISRRFFPWFTCLVSFIPCLLILGLFALSIVGMIKAINGQRFRIPVLTDFAENLKI